VQRLAQRLLGNRCGAVVAMSPHTGALYVMASSPTYDPNEVDQPGGYARILHVRGACEGASALYDRATQGLFTPGSTFKIVTAAAALDTGAFTPNSGFNDPGYCTEYGQKVFNSGNPDQGGHEVFGHLNLLSGFQHSVNSVFCNVGMKLGAKTLVDYAKRFGFYKVPPLETPANERLPSGTYDQKTHRLTDDASKMDPGRLAFGQWTMEATPLQMAMVAATVANGGVVPRPYIVQ
jgi:peptidoglycan glycosyltransferase